MGLRYGSFPIGRLSKGKQDVVDNDAELMILLEREEDVDFMGAKLSLTLEALGWPPCVNPHVRKYVCFSLRHAIPLKLELYFMVKDADQGLIYASRSCTAPGECTYLAAHPLQQWGGKVPWSVIYPVRPCRVGSVAWLAPCPNKPVDLIKGWNAGEYEAMSLVRTAATAQGTANSVPSVHPGTDNLGKSACFALPIMSKDRDAGDERNIELQVKGLVPEDLHLLAGYARALHKQGFASFQG